MTADVKEYIRTHPEIVDINLTWLWSFRSETYLARYHGGPETILVSEGWRLDQEYSYFGGREGALRFLDDYDCWEGVSIDWTDPDTSVSAEKGRLEVVHREYAINDSVDDLPTDPLESVEVVFCMTSHVEIEEADE